MLKVKYINEAINSYVFLSNFWGKLSKQGEEARKKLGTLKFNWKKFMRKKSDERVKLVG